MSCSIALQRLYDEYLLPFIHAKVAGVTIKKVLSSDEVLLLFHENITLLGRFFLKYSNSENKSAENNTSDKKIVVKRDDEMLPTDDDALDLKQFTNLVNDAFVINAISVSKEKEVTAEGETAITLKDVRQVIITTLTIHFLSSKQITTN